MPGRILASFQNPLRSPTAITSGLRAVITAWWARGSRRAAAAGTWIPKGSRTLATFDVTPTGGVQRFTPTAPVGHEDLLVVRRLGGEPRPLDVYFEVRHSRVV